MCILGLLSISDKQKAQIAWDIHSKANIRVYEICKRTYLPIPRYYHAGDMIDSSTNLH